MNSTGDRKPEPDDPDVALRMIELEMMRERAARQARTPYRGLRAASLIFLVIVVLGVLIACYFVFRDGGLERLRARNTAPSSDTPASAQPNP